MCYYVVAREDMMMTQNNMTQLVRLGRYMITQAPTLADDAQCNRWARAGQLLTSLGMPFSPRLREFCDEDQAAVREAAAVATGRVPEPPRLRFEPPTEERRTRRARMTRVMSKPRRVEQAKKMVKASASKGSTSDEPRRRGRPPGSKNKVTVITAAESPRRGRPPGSKNKK
jgi:hypothetical protein